MTKHTGTGHPRPVTIRTAKTADAFLAALADKGSVTAAALAAHVSRVPLYAWRNEDAEFRTRWDEALELGLSKLEDVAAERALGGMSDTLLIFLLKARRGYRDTIYSRVAGEDGGPIRTQVDLTDPAAVNDRIRALLSRAQGAADA